MEAPTIRAQAKLARLADRAEGSGPGPSGNVTSAASGVPAGPSGGVSSDLRMAVMSFPRIPVPANCEDAYPLSAMQRLMLKHYSAEAGTYHFQGILEFEDRTPGDVDLELMRKAFCWEAERHPLMRAFVVSTDGLGVQAIRKTFEGQVTLVDVFTRAPPGKRRSSKEFSRRIGLCR